MMLPHILLIEDNLEDAELLKAALIQTGLPHKLVVVHFAKDAIKYLAGFGEFEDKEKFPKPVVVILDLGLPGMSGLEFLIWAQDEPAGEIPPIVVVSCSTVEQDRHLAKKFGAKEFFVKSSDPEKTVDTLRKILIESFPPNLTGPDDHSLPKQL